MLTGHLYGRLDSFGSGVAKIYTPRHTAGKKLNEFLRQFHHVFVVETRAGHVEEFRRLPLNGLDKSRVRVPSGNNGNPGIEVQELVPVHVLDDGTFAARQDKWIASSVVWREEPCVSLDDCLSLRNGQ